jgi:hypothetical protein
MFNSAVLMQYQLCEQVLGHESSGIVSKGQPRVICSYHILKVLSQWDPTSNTLTLAIELQWSQEQHAVR